MNAFFPLADLGLERSPAAERGLVAWAIVIGTAAAFACLLATRRGGWLNAATPAGPLSPDRGWPFMKRVLLGVAQVGAGVLAVYALARWVGPPQGRPEGWHLIRPPHEVTVLAQQGDVIWAGGREGLFAVDRRSLARVEKPSLKAKDLRGVKALLAEGDVLWIGCRQGLYRCEQDRFELSAPSHQPDLGPVGAVRRTRDGALWVGVRGGAWRVVDGSWHWFGNAEGLSVPGVDVIYEDREGNLWFGSNDPEATALYRRRVNEGKFVDGGEGLTSHAVNDLMEDREGTLWIATGFGARGGAARFDGQGWMPCPDIPDIAREKIRSLFEDSRQRLWFASEYNGVAIRGGGAWKRLLLRDGLPGSEVKDVVEDEDGTLWLATELGLGCLRSLAWPAASE